MARSRTLSINRAPVLTLWAAVVAERLGFEREEALTLGKADGKAITAVGVILACRMKTFEGFGSISNGVIQPLYFLSGAIFPLKGIMGGVGFLDIPQSLRDELYRHGIYTIGGGWVVELPTWLKVLVYANPVSYMLDLLRLVTLGFSQLPMTVNLLAVLAFPPLVVVLAARAMAALRRA